MDLDSPDAATVDAWNVDSSAVDSSALDDEDESEIGGYGPTRRESESAP